MKKIYIAYEGDLNRHGYQIYSILGVFTWKHEAVDAVKQTITGSDVEVRTNTVDGLTTTWWNELGMENLNVGKVEEHILIG